MTSSSAPEPAEPVGRVYVFDGSGGLRRVFDDAELAHAYAHEQTQTPPARGREPERLEVFEPDERVSRFVGAGRCFEVRWMAVNTAGYCSVPTVIPPGGLWQVHQ